MYTGQTIPRFIHHLASSGRLWSFRFYFPGCSDSDTFLFWRVDEYTEIISWPNLCWVGFQQKCFKSVFYAQTRRLRSYPTLRHAETPRNATSQICDPRMFPLSRKNNSGILVSPVRGILKWWPFHLRFCYGQFWFKNFSLGFWGMRKYFMRNAKVFYLEEGTMHEVGERNKKWRDQSMLSTKVQFAFFFYGWSTLSVSIRISPVSGDTRNLQESYGLHFASTTPAVVVLSPVSHPPKPSMLA